LQIINVCLLLLLYPPSLLILFHLHERRNIFVTSCKTRVSHRRRLHWMNFETRFTYL